MKPVPFRPAGDRGFSLLEALIVVAGIGVMAAVGIVKTGNVTQRVAEQKLSQDVETINRAVQTYEMNGGNMEWFNLLPHPWWIQGQLKVKVANVDTVTGLTGSLVDSRLHAELMTPAEASSSAARAVWDVTKGKYVVIHDNSISGEKVARFVLSDEAPPALENIALNMFPNQRTNRAFDYASTDKWVWDYADTVATAGPAPTSIPLSPGAPTTPGAGPGPLPALDPPTYSLSSGSHALTNFPVALAIGNPNSAAVSEIIFWTSVSGWQEYDGTPFPVMPGTAVKAFAKSTDTATWRDSDFADSVYDAIPVTLEVAVTAPGSVTWGEAGGPLQPGGPAPTLATEAEITIFNEAAIPDLFESSANISIFWTTDGSDPLSSPTRSTASAFTGGFPGQSVDISLPVWGANTSLEIQSAAVSLDADLFNSSGVTSRTVSINKTNLRNPVVSDSLAIVTIDLDTSFGDMPVGARVYYTLDGTDPGDVNGDPVTGTEYAGPFSVKGLTTYSVPVRARVYGTDGYEQWFESSAVYAATVVVPPAVMAFSHTASLSEP